MVHSFSETPCVKCNAELCFLHLRIFSEKTRLFTANDLIDISHQTAVAKGWWDNPDSFGDKIALMHSELSEAFEHYRRGHGINEIFYEDGKPDGIPIELADVVIRMADFCGKFGIDLDKAIRLKMRYNMTRPYRHGGKKL